MRRSMGFATRVGMVFLVAVSAWALVGCPKPKPDLAVPTPEIRLASPSGTGTLEIDNEGSGDLEWKLLTDVPWLRFSKTQGIGKALIEITIDLALLHPLSVNRGHITVESNGGTVTVTVEVPTPIMGLNPEYWPLEVGNSWNYGLASGATIPVITKALAACGKYADEDTMFTFTVADELTVNDLTVWQVDVTVPGLDIPFPDVPFKSVPVPNSLPTYWVKVGSEWFLALTEDDLDALPSTDNMASVVELSRLPGYWTYLLFTNRLEQVTSDVMVIVDNTSAELEPLYDALAAYMDDAMAGNTEDAFALLAAYSTEFSAYSASSSPLVNDIVQLSGDVAGSVEPLAELPATLQGIVSQAQSDIQEYIYGQEAMPTPDDMAPVLEAFGAEFADYSNPDPVLQALVRFLAQVGEQGGPILADMDEYTEEDQLAIQDFTAAFLEVANDPDNSALIYSDPQAYIALLQEFVDTYETDNAALEDVLALLTGLMDGVDALVTAIEDYEVSGIDLANIDQLVDDLAAFSGSFSAANPDNPVGVIVDIVLVAAQDVMDPVMEVAPHFNAVRDDLVQLAADLQHPDDETFDLEAVSLAAGDLATFFDAYNTANDDVLAEAAAITLSGVQDGLAVATALQTDVEALEFAEAQGSLSSLLPSDPVAITLDDFGIADQDDCIAAQVIIPGEALENPAKADDVTVPTTIWAEGIGPVLWGQFTLKGAQIGNQTYGNMVP